MVARYCGLWDKKNNMANRKYNSGKWTPARFRSFVKSGLRALSNKWPPKYECRKAAWVERGVYRCAGYKQKPHNVSASIGERGKKKNNIFIDHIVPVIDPIKGFTTWDKVVANLFCEKKNLQVLCLNCHKEKSSDERKQRRV